MWLVRGIMRRIIYKFTAKILFRLIFIALLLMAVVYFTSGCTNISYSDDNSSDYDTSVVPGTDEYSFNDITEYEIADNSDLIQEIPATQTDSNIDNIDNQNAYSTIDIDFTQIPDFDGSRAYVEYNDNIP